MSDRPFREIFLCILCSQGGKDNSVVCKVLQKGGEVSYKSQESPDVGSGLGRGQFIIHSIFELSGCTPLREIR